MISHNQKSFYYAFLLLFLTDYVFSETSSRTPARILAKQTGAAQFEEHIEQPLHHNCNEHRHRLRKRSSDEDLDYEVYQGVVGRPGIDFPIFPRIPQTTFSCRSYGNGYFADLETNCQVFHICEEGRKISFLCPNGTIFQQSELTCDWWFKVNCAGSPGFYAESSEILSKSRRNRLKANSLYKGYKNNNKVTEIVPESRNAKGTDRRLDSNENPSVESFDFEDLSDDRSGDKSIDRSIDTSNDRSNYRSNSRPSDRSNVRSNQRSKDRSNDRSNDNSSDRSSDRSNNRSSTKPTARNNNRSNTKSNEKLKILKDELLTNPPQDDNHNQHNDQELQITAESSSFVKNPRINSYTSSDKTLNKESELNSGKISDKAKDAQNLKTSSPSRGNQKHTFVDNEKSKQKVDSEKPTGFYITAKPDINVASTTGKASYYTTANSLEDSSSSEKQFVTPDSEDRPALEAQSTIRPDFFINGPLISRVTTPSQYPGVYATARRIDTTRTTPFYTPTIPVIAKTKPTESKGIIINSAKSDEPTTLRGAITTQNTTPKPVTTAGKEDKSDIHRFSIFSNKDLNVQLPIHSEISSKLTDNSQGSSTSGPTYLPKNTTDKKDNLVTTASVDNFVSRNVNGILQTVGVLKETMNKAVDDKGSSPRVGLEIPPSSGPGTLLSLTNYFANDDHTVSTTISDETTTIVPTTAINISAGLLSDKTSEKYLSLFGLNQDKDKSNIGDYSSGSTVSPKIVNSPTVVGDFTRTTIRDLVKDPETRKIAQVFSNAISKYIENPDTFRKDLIDVRPQPPAKSSNLQLDTTTPSYNLNKGNTVSNNNRASTPKPLLSTTEAYETTTTTPTTESNDIAKEINNQFDVSTPLYGSVFPDSTETTTTRSDSFSTTIPQAKIDIGISSELLPPTLDEEIEHESLHKVQSQSFVKSYNDLKNDPKSNTFNFGKNRLENTQTENPWTDKSIDTTLTTTIKQDSTETTENPWSQSHKSDNRNIFVTSTYSPLKNTPKTDKISSVKVNPTQNSWTTKNNLKVESDTTAGAPWLQNQLPTLKPTENPWSQITQSIYLDPLTINDGLMREPKTTTSRPFNYINTDRSRFEDVSQGEEDIEDLLNSPELSSELLPKNNGLQRIANKIFGGLNETEALHLQNVMKKAEHNQSVLRLLLLLIQTCDDQNGKALEKSRKILLSALIGMDDKLKIKNTSQISASITTTSTTTNKIPVTTYRRVYNDKTTTTSATTTELSNSSEETTRFEIRVPDPEDEDDNTISTSKPVSSNRQPKSYNNPNRTSDERALELLKSLYSLASKFSRR